MAERLVKASRILLWAVERNRFDAVSRSQALVDKYKSIIGDTYKLEKYGFGNSASAH